MKNSLLAKTLLCGVMASTFFLINCQKAPSHGVKAQSTSGANVSGKIDTTGKLMVACSADFMSKYTVSSELVKKIKLDSAKLDSLDAAQKETLNSEVKDAQNKVSASVAEITKIKADADGCNEVDPKTKDIVPYYKAAIMSEFNNLVIALNDKGIQVDGVTAQILEAKKLADANKIQREKQNDLKGLSNDMEFVLSSDLADVLKVKNIGEALYFKDGHIIQSPSTEAQKIDKADAKLTLCEIGSGTSDVVKDETAVVKNIESPKLDTTKNRMLFAVNMTTKTSMIRFECILADGKKDSFQAEFRKVFADMLQSKKLLDAQAQIQAKEELNKKEATLQLAKAATQKAQDEVDANDKELAKAVAAKDEATIKSLTAKKAELADKLKSAKDAETAATQAEAAVDANKATDNKVKS